MSNRIIVTGLSITKDLKDDPCLPCNFDYSWMFKHPSTLLWADKIIFTPSMVDVITNLCWSTKEMRVGKLLKLYYELAESHGLVEVRDPRETTLSELTDSLHRQSWEDRDLLAANYPEQVKLGGDMGIQGEFQIGEEHWCCPRVESLYYSLALATIWDTRLLLDDHSSTYLSYRFGKKISRTFSVQSKMEGFAQVIKNRLPEVDIVPSVVKYQRCRVCEKPDLCESMELKNTEKVVLDYLRWRTYDEIIEMKATYDRIARQVKSLSSEPEVSEIVAEFKKAESRIDRKLRGLFPKIERWSNLTTICSIPLMIIGANSGTSLLTTIGAVSAGIAQIAKQYVDLLKNKYRWVCFRQT